MVFGSVALAGTGDVSEASSSAWKTERSRVSFRMEVSSVKGYVGKSIDLRRPVASTSM